MDNSRSYKKVFLWDYIICTNNWSAEVKIIMNKLVVRNFEHLDSSDINTGKKLLHDMYDRDWSQKTLTQN